MGLSYRPWLVRVKPRLRSDRSPHRLGPQRRGVELQPAKSIRDRIGHDRGGRHATALAHALDAERVGTKSLDVAKRDVRRFHRARNLIVGHGDGHRLAIVKGKLLEQRAADALDDAALHLAL